MDASSRLPLYHLNVASGLPAIDVHVRRFRFPAIKISPSASPWISGGPGGSKILTNKKLFILHEL